MRDPDLLRAAIERSGLTQEMFAATVELPHLYSERTVRRWLTGEYDLPAPVRAFLLQYLELSTHTRA